MKKLVFTTFLMILFAVSANAQVTIGENAAPDAQAVLDLRAGATTKKGLLMPRVTLTALNNVAPFTASLAAGMSVYHTGPVASGNTLPAGIYTWDGAKWVSGASELANGAIYVLKQKYDGDTEGDVRIVYDTTDEKLYQEVYDDTSNTWIRTELGGGGGEPWFYMPSILFDVSPETYENNPDGITVNLYDRYKEQFNTETDGLAVVKSDNAPELPTLTTVPAAKNAFYYYIIGYDTAVFEITSLTDTGDLTYNLKQPGNEKTFINIVFVRK